MKRILLILYRLYSTQAGFRASRQIFPMIRGQKYSFLLQLERSLASLGPIANSQKRSDMPIITFKEIYLCFDPLEADIIRNMLERAGIPCIIRDMRIGPYPLTIGQFAEMRVAVEPAHLRQAVKIIRQAREDDYLSPQGKFKDDVPQPV